MLSRLALPSVHRSLRLPLQYSRHFHQSTIWSAEAVDHYGALGLEPNASPTAIKKSTLPLSPQDNTHLTTPRQFYALSKTHHPDHNPTDPSASDRFVNISEAYAILGNASKRQKYDREIGSASPNLTPNVRRGSHSSSANGARPASGLSKRRTQFRGPPPSFYRNGAWGSQGAKRQAQAEAATSSEGTGYGGGGGYGPGQAQTGWDVPHFDREAHLRTQEQQERRWMLRRRNGEDDVGYGGKGMLIQFLLLSGIVSVAVVLPSLFEKDNEPKRKRVP